MGPTATGSTNRWARKTKTSMRSIPILPTTRVDLLTPPNTWACTQNRPQRWHTPSLVEAEVGEKVVPIHPSHLMSPKKARENPVPRV